MRTVLLLIAFATCCHALLPELKQFAQLSSFHSTAWNPKPEDFIQWMKEGGMEVTGTEPFPVLRRKIIDRVRTQVEGWIGELSPSSQMPNTKEYPYFGFIPNVVGSVLVGGPTLSWSNACFQQNSASAAQTGPETVTVTVSVSNATSFLCSDLYFFTTIAGVSVKNFLFGGSYTIDYNLTGLTPAELWDISTKGVRVFSFVDNIVQTLLDVLSTVLMFGSEATQGVPQWVSDVNLDFMTKYRGVTMVNRTTQLVPIDESLISSGDFFGIIRLDGLDPMLAWAMGSTTGHTTVALRMDGQLYIVESTVNDSYWPTNGIQKTPYQQWVQQAVAAGYNVVWAPLTAEYRAKFNETAAAAKFHELEGFNYGYHNLLFGWIDTIKDNYPCVPPDYTQCLTIEAVELIISAADRLAPSIGDLIFDQALNIRLGTSGLKAPDLLYEAYKQGLDFAQVPVIVEQDSFIYNTTRNGIPSPGPSMVCCVFVCNMWKAGGIFDEINSEVNCAELTNWDDYALTIIDPAPVRPQQCIDADPTNPQCQIVGQYTVALDNFSTKKMFPWMAQSCPSEAPKYQKPPTC